MAFEEPPIAAAVRAALESPNADTAYKIAARAGVSPDTLYAVRDGKGARIESLNAILEALGIRLVPPESSPTPKRRKRRGAAC